MRFAWLPPTASVDPGRARGAREVTARTSTARDAFAPGGLFPIAFVFSYTVPYLNLVDYRDLTPPPGVQMASLAALGLLSCLIGWLLACVRWPTSDLTWPRVDANEWRGPWVLGLRSQSPTSGCSRSPFDWAR